MVARPLSGAIFRIRDAPDGSAVLPDIIIGKREVN